MVVWTGLRIYMWQDQGEYESDVTDIDFELHAEKGDRLFGFYSQMMFTPNHWLNAL